MLNSDGGRPIDCIKKKLAFGAGGERNQTASSQFCLRWGQVATALFTPSPAKAFLAEGGHWIV
jgi:hypothetical protein